MVVYFIYQVRVLYDKKLHTSSKLTRHNKRAALPGTLENIINSRYGF